METNAGSHTNNRRAAPPTAIAGNSARDSATAMTVRTYTIQDTAHRAGIDAYAGTGEILDVVISEMIVSSSTTPLGPGRLTPATHGAAATATVSATRIVVVARMDVPVTARVDVPATVAAPAATTLNNNEARQGAMSASQ